MSQDVIAVSLDDSSVRLMAADLSEKNAEAVIYMAVLRRGVDSEFFVAVPSGSYTEGEQYPKEVPL